MSTPLERLASYIKEKVGKRPLRQIVRESETLKNYNSISGILKNKSTPNLETFVNIAEALKVDPHEMLEAYMGRPHIDREDNFVRIALEWARLAKRQGDSIWVAKIQHDINSLRQLIAEGNVAPPDSEPNGGEEEDRPKKPTPDSDTGPVSIHKQFGARIAV